MELIVWGLAAATIVFAALAMLSSGGERFFLCVAALVFFVGTLVFDNVDGRTKVPSNAVNITIPLKTGHEYQLIYKTADPEDYVVMVMDNSDGSYRTLRVKAPPPEHFVVGDDQRLIELKEYRFNSPK